MYTAIKKYINFYFIKLNTFGVNDRSDVSLFGQNWQITFNK
jgi:hypothetical protein